MYLILPAREWLVQVARFAAGAEINNKPTPVASCNMSWTDNASCSLSIFHSRATNTAGKNTNSRSGLQ